MPTPTTDTDCCCELLEAAERSGRGVWVWTDRKGVVHSGLEIRGKKCTVIMLVTEEVDDWRI